MGKIAKRCDDVTIPKSSVPEAILLAGKILGMSAEEAVARFVVNFIRPKKNVGQGVHTSLARKEKKDKADRMKNHVGKTTHCRTRKGVHTHNNRDRHESND